MNYSLTKRYSLFIVLLLIIFPFIFSLFISAKNYAFQLRTVYLLMKPYVLSAILVFILVLLVKDKINDLFKRDCFAPPPLVARLAMTNISICLFIIGVLFLLFSFWTQRDYERILNQGIVIDDYVHFDAKRWLCPSFFGDQNVLKNQELVLSGNNNSMRKYVEIKSSVLLHPIVKWRTYWKDKDGDNVLSQDAKVIMKINGFPIDVTDKYRALSNAQKVWLECPLTSSRLLKDRRNEIILEKLNCPDDIYVTLQTVYYSGNTSKREENKWKVLDFDEALLYIPQEENKLFSFCFKMGFIFRMLGILSLFLAIFGFGFIKFLLRDARLELVFSFVYAPLAYITSIEIRKCWIFLAKGVTYGVYWLLRWGYSNAYMSFNNVTHPVIGVSEFSVNIADTCSGIESFSYFLVTYSFLLIFYWKKIRLKRALFLILPGIIGAYLINILRVYLIILVGIYISKEFAVNTFHTYTGMALFLLYFWMFWGVSKKLVLKELERRETRDEGRSRSEISLYSQ